MAHYDIILVGGGAAGLSLAYRLARSPLRDRSVLVVDRDAKDRDDCTWCFWTDRPTPFESIVHRSWRRLRLATERVDRTIDLGPYRYQMIRGIDFYRFVQRDVTARGRVDIVQGTVDRIEDNRTGATVLVDGHAFTGAWVFDSRRTGRLNCTRPDPETPSGSTGHPHAGPRPAPSREAGPRYHDLQQHFTGWTVCTSHPAFTPDAPTFLDFRTPQHGAMRFFYVLPFTANRALVEYVECGPAPTHREQHEQALEAYLHGSLGLADYHIDAREGGANLLTSRPFPRRAWRHVMTIGALGGRVKPTSGFAFMRIQRDSAAIVASLVRAGHPFAIPPGPRRYRWYDRAMLEIMAGQGERIEPIFTALFTRNPIERVFRFLDERASLCDDLRLAATLPPDVALRLVAR